MSENTPLDQAALARRARIHAGVEPDPQTFTSLDSLARALDELLVDVDAHERPWVLPEGARMKGTRSAALRVLKVFIDQQQHLDSTLISAVALLVAYCGALEMQVEALAVSVEALQLDAPKDGAGA
jgi:hypothetical protein